TLGNLKNLKLGIGAWVPTVWYYYNKETETFYMPNGTQRQVSAIELPSDFYMVPNESGTEVYIFDENGLIIETKLGLTGQTIRSFYYDNDSQLAYITEPFGKTTTFNRDSSGNLISITSPNG